MLSAEKKGTHLCATMDFKCASHLEDFIHRSAHFPKPPQWSGGSSVVVLMVVLVIGDWCLVAGGGWLQMAGDWWLVIGFGWLGGWLGARVAGR